MSMWPSIGTRPSQPAIRGSTRAQQRRTLLRITGRPLECIACRRERTGRGPWRRGRALTHQLLLLLLAVPAVRAQRVSVLLHLRQLAPTALQKPSLLFQSVQLRRNHGLPAANRAPVLPLALVLAQLVAVPAAAAALEEAVEAAVLTQLMLAYASTRRTWACPAPRKR